MNNLNALKKYYDNSRYHTLADGEIVGGQYGRPEPGGENSFQKYIETGDRSPFDRAQISMAEEQWKRDNAPELANTLNQILGTQTGFTQNKFSGKELEMLRNINLLLGKEKQLTPESIKRATYEGDYSNFGYQLGDVTDEQISLEKLLDVIYANQRRDYQNRNYKGEDLIEANKYYDHQMPSGTRAEDYPNFNYFFGGR
jgi:hypothetical protein